ncbi:hypothetical protein BS47DRAFT_1397794 [Hydnum rufescens UP504]|uniref:CCHC-type domain-containing protein n=1 Tax=Hydnum rufescens UP504 TaxID=1448309 RepID=A0A9P6AME3_9AGAM|nr:hypothetical protein BS47DRAFT_1397794 [Hydnum rufescens UP504]
MYEVKPVLSLVHGPPARSQCIEREDFSLPSVYRNVDSASSNDDSRVYSKLNNAILHWFPLADEVVEPTSPSTSHNSQSTLCLPPLHPIMSKCVKTPRQNPHMAIPHYVPSSQHEDILYHATTHECVAIPPRLHLMECYREVTQCLDKLVNEYTDPFLSAPITTYQFLMIVKGNLTEQLWMSKRIEELRMADKLLKLHVELTFAWLYKLRKLHQASKFAEYDVNLEEALNVQPLPRVETDPHGLGLFVPGSEFEEPSIGTSLGPDQGPRAGPGSIINLPAWPMPPSDQTRLGNSSALQASSIDLDASPSNWQDIPLYDSTPRERVNSTGEGDEYPGHAWNSVTDTPTLPALGATRAHDYYMNIVKTEPFSLSHMLFPHNPTSMPLSKPGSQHTAPMPSQGSSQKESLGPPMEDSKDKGPSPPPPSHPQGSNEGGGGPPSDGGEPGRGGGSGGEAQGEAAQPQEYLLVENSQEPRSTPPPSGVTWDNQLKWAAVPEWDGDQDTAIDWLYECNDLVGLGPAIENQLAQIAAFRFKGAVATAWWAHSVPVKHSIVQSWDTLREWVLHKYLGEAWYTAQRIKYNEETFHSVDHLEESPAEYIQRCILLSRIFLHFTPNSPEETVSVMNNTPMEWDVVLRWSDRPPIKSVLMHAKQFEATLVMQWRSSQHYRRCQETKNSKRANFVAQEDKEERSERDLLHSKDSDDPDGAFYYSSEEAEGGKATSMAFSVGRRPGGRPYRPPCRPYPREKRADTAEKTYPYPRDDTVVSHHKPNQKCFTCGSEKHWVRDCKHFGAYSNHLERRMLKKEHRRYETPDYKAAYSVMVNAVPNF